MNVIRSNYAKSRQGDMEIERSQNALPFEASFSTDGISFLKLNFHLRLPILPPHYIFTHFCVSVEVFLIPFLANVRERTSFWLAYWQGNKISVSVVYIHFYSWSDFNWKLSFIAFFVCNNSWNTIFIRSARFVSFQLCVRCGLIWLLQPQTGLASIIRQNAQGRRLN